jgi:hypothetical protein
LIDLLEGFCGPSASSLASMFRLPSNAVIAVRNPLVSLMGGEVIVFGLCGTWRGEGECDEGIRVVCLSCSISAADSRRMVRLGSGDVDADHGDRPK